MDLGDKSADGASNCADSSTSPCRDAGVPAGNLALFHIDSEDYTWPGESSPRRSYAFVGDTIHRDASAPLEFGCLKAFERDESGQCVLCTDDELPRTAATSGVLSETDVRIHSVTAVGGELSEPITLRWEGQNAPLPTVGTFSSTNRAWGAGPAIEFAAAFFSDDPHFADSMGGDILLEAKARLSPPRYLVFQAGSPPPGQRAHRDQDLVFTWAPREGAASATERVRIALETKAKDLVDQDYRSTGRVRRVSCEFESATGRGAIRAGVLGQMAKGAKLTSVLSVSSTDVVGPIHPRVRIPWLVRYELRSTVRTPQGDAIDEITLE